MGNIDITYCGHQSYGFTASTLLLPFGHFVFRIRTLKKLIQTLKKLIKTLKNLIRTHKIADRDPKKKLIRINPNLDLGKGGAGFKREKNCDYKSRQIQSL